MIVWNTELYHSWGKSPKQKSREKQYNKEYYKKHKDKWGVKDTSTASSKSSKKTTDKDKKDDGKIHISKKEMQAAMDIWYKGNYGNGEERKKRLKKAGLDYHNVQTAVNELVRVGYNEKKANIVVDDSAKKSSNTKTTKTANRPRARVKTTTSSRSESSEKTSASVTTPEEKRQALSDREKVLRKARKWARRHSNKRVGIGRDTRKMIEEWEEEQKKKKKKAKTSDQ